MGAIRQLRLSNTAAACGAQFAPGSNGSGSCARLIPALLDAGRIADVLGGVEALGKRITTLSALNAAVQRGLPKRALPSVGLVPEVTYKRRKSRLSRLESERTERLARVVAMVETVWDDPAAAKRFLITPHRTLGGRTPLEMAGQELGARQVEEIIAAIVYGLPA